ncbi:amidase family protein [Sphingomonas sp. DT-204]|uniref:amidase family protein n=1 Tax=Sphingomonas sp. DT-204 TaxID=3396166 RepID=UPI003F1D49ED
MTRDDAFAIGRLDAHDQAALVHGGEVTAAELVESAIVRIEALDGAINAVSHRAFDQARARVDGTKAMPVPYLVKEGLSYPGMPTRYGSRAFADVPPVGPGSAFPYVERLDAAGLVALGKSSAPEFALLPTTEPVLYGPVRNPWARDRSAGGSSGGAAAAVAAGMVPLAHAADGGGSIRIPASCCGVVGLKPGRGSHVRARPAHVVEDMLVGDTLLARSVRDVTWATAATGHRYERQVTPARPLRIAMVTRTLEGEEPHRDVAEAVGRAAGLCRALGHEIEPVTGIVDGGAVARAFKVIWGYLAHEAMAGVAPLIAGRAVEEVLEPWTLGLAGWGARLGPDQLERALADAAAATMRWESALERFDMVLSPVVRDPPPLLGTLAPTRPFETLMPAMFGYLGYTQLHNLVGAPAISLPLHWNDTGLPIGCMFAATRGDEARLLALAAALEEASPWRDRWPAVSIVNTGLEAMVE